MGKKNKDYVANIALNHNEIPAKVNGDTGEVTVIKKRGSNIPEGKEVFEPDGIFKKDYTKSWEYLDKVLTPLEYKVVSKLCRMAKMNTNSLEPLNDDTTALALSEEFNIDHRTSKKLFKRLFDLGVYAKFEASKPDIPYTKYWIVNPYLSFSGKLIDSDIRLLFVGTIIEKVFSGKMSF